MTRVFIAVLPETLLSEDVSCFLTSSNWIIISFNGFLFLVEYIHTIFSMFVSKKGFVPVFFGRCKVHLQLLTTNLYIGVDFNSLWHYWRIFVGFGFLKFENSSVCLNIFVLQTNITRTSTHLMFFV